MVASPRTFRCLNCNEMIDDSMTQCRYCSVRVDPVVAQLFAERQEKAVRSYQEVSYLRMAVVAMYVFIVLSYIPLLWFIRISGLGIVITFFVAFVLLMRWQRKFGRLVTNEAALIKARRSFRLWSVLWLVGLPLGAFGYLLFKLATR